MKLCDCGCGGEVSKPGNKFIRGHNRGGINLSDGTKKKMSDSAIKDRKEHPLSESDKKRISIRMKKYFKEHPVSDETREKQSETTKLQWINIEERKKQSDRLKIYWDLHPEDKERERQRNLKRFEDPLEHEKSSKVSKKYYDKIDDPGLVIIGHHIAYDFDRPEAFVVQITSRFHSSIHHPKGVQIGKRGYSLID